MKRLIGRCLLIAGFGSAVVMGVLGIHAAILLGAVTVGVIGLFLVGSSTAPARSRVAGGHTGGDAGGFGDTDGGNGNGGK